MDAAVPTLPYPAVADGCVRLYLGTSTRGLEVACERGSFHPRDHRALAHEIETEFGLPEDAVWEHRWFEYVRGSRARDPHVYTTDDFDNACYYANTLNESTVDALKTAHRIINDDLMRTLERLDLPSEEERRRWKESEQGFIDAWRAKHPELAPVVLAIDCPIEEIPVPEHVRERFTPAQWWEAVTHGGKVFAHEIPFPEPLPYRLVVGELRLDAAGC